MVLSQEPQKKETDCFSDFMQTGKLVSVTFVVVAKLLKVFLIGSLHSSSLYSPKTWPFCFGPVRHHASNEAHGSI